MIAVAVGALPVAAWTPRAVADEPMCTATDCSFVSPNKSIECVITVAGTDVTNARGAALAHVRANVQMVFQDPLSSLDPRQSVESLLVEGMQAHGLAKNAKDARPRLRELS